jgi:hypothetical protein
VRVGRKDMWQVNTGLWERHATNKYQNNRHDVFKGIKGERERTWMSHTHTHTPDCTHARTFAEGFDGFVRFIEFPCSNQALY